VRPAPSPKAPPEPLETRRAPSTRSTSPVPGASLTSRDWTVLALVLVEKLSLLEAACTLDVTPTELRRRYERALSRLRRSMAPGAPYASREPAAMTRRAS
jgi:sigma-70-like protein